MSPPISGDVLEERLEAIRQELMQLRLDVVRILDDHEGRVRRLEASDIRQDERINMRTGLLTGMQVILAAIAAWLGMSK